MKKKTGCQSRQWEGSQGQGSKADWESNEGHQDEGRQEEGRQEEERRRRNFVISEDPVGEGNRNESRSFGLSDLFLISIKPMLPDSS